MPRLSAGEHRSTRFAAWAERLWARPLLHGGIALLALVALALPVLGLRTGMPSIAVVPEDQSSRVGYSTVVDAFGPGAPACCRWSSRPRPRSRPGRGWSATPASSR